MSTNNNNNNNNNIANYTDKDAHYEKLLAEKDEEIERLKSILKDVSLYALGCHVFMHGDAQEPGCISAARAALAELDKETPNG